MIISVAIPRPVEGFFTYRVPEELRGKLLPGCWVKVPFGRGSTHAFIVEVEQEDSALTPGLDPASLKNIQELGSAEPVISPDVMQLCRWAAAYYHTPLGELLNCAVPKAALGMKTARKEARSLNKILPFDANIEVPPLRLNEEQTEAVRLAEADQSRKPILLEGVTGSGKTEVYLSIARKILDQGKSVLILVPEIALTPQLHTRLEKGLGQRVGQWHSALSDGVRRDLAAALRSGELRVLVGARSAVFAPLKDLSLIIVDEEHDSSYKQEDRVKYHARDLAVLRARNLGATVILGSATPSMESLERAREGRYQHLRLKKRFSNRPMPLVETVDLKIEPWVAGLQAPLAEKTRDAIREVLAKGEQALIFLNRRGFAAFILCEDCGHVTECPDCSISLTFHKKQRLLKCHFCGLQQSVPEQCTKCTGLNLKPMGAGTESLEEELPQLIPEMIPLRLDRDQVTSATRLGQVLEEFRSGKANTLLGTQMLVKGHDFPGVTLVVVVLADGLFSWPDFRSCERALQVLTQVSGRAGRGEIPGKVLIQTFQPDHPVLKIIRGELPFETWMDQEREVRQLLSYPPFGRLAKIRFESKNSRDAEMQAKNVCDQLQQRNIGGLEILGPSEALIEKAKGLYRWDLILRSTQVPALHSAVEWIQKVCRQQKFTPIVEIDPYTVG